MHDLDRTLGRTHMENESLFEFTSEAEAAVGYENENFEFQAEQPEVFNEAEVNELAAELLSVANQQELNHFLGDLMKKVSSGISSPLGQQLGGMLKSAARVALPVVGSAIGNTLVPGVGGAVGGKLASMAGSMFGLETEGMTQEDRQYEVAKQFVRFGGDATQKALALTKEGSPIPAAAKAAVQQAAERFVPGLVANSPSSVVSSTRPHLAHKGSWFRQGNKIILQLGRE
jgi:uncharacterized protein (DUF697 family)